MCLPLVDNGRVATVASVYPDVFLVAYTTRTLAVVVGKANLFTRVALVLAITGKADVGRGRLLTFTLTTFPFFDRDAFLCPFFGDLGVLVLVGRL